MQNFASKKAEIYDFFSSSKTTDLLEVDLELNAELNALTRWP